MSMRMSIPVTISLTPHVLECLEKLTLRRFGSDAKNKRSVLVQTLIVAECERIELEPENKRVK